MIAFAEQHLIVLCRFTSYADMGVMGQAAWA